MSVRRRPSLFSYLSFQGRNIFSGSSGDPSGTNKRVDSRDRSDSVTATLRPSDSKRYDSERKMATPVGSRLIKLVAVVGAIFILFFLLSPSGTKQSVETYIKDNAPTNPIHHAAPVNVEKPKSAPLKSQGPGQKAIDSLSGTTRCTTSISYKKPLVQYALMIDAGSQGSRIHVYRFNNCDDTPELEQEFFEETRPGLSSYKERAEEAAASLDVLMEVALKNVPDSLKGCSPVAVKATAGLRMLGLEKSENILKAVRHRLETKYPFPVVKGRGIEIMEGKDEGVYAWITVNYLLGKIGSIADTPTAAVFDLGGGSTQIVFEPTFKQEGGGMPTTLAPGDHKYDLTFGGRHFSLYQHSHLGYGLMEGRKSIHRALVDKVLSDSTWDRTSPLINPCLIPGTSLTTTIDLDDKSSLSVKFIGPDSNSAPQCRALAELVLNKEKPCTLAPCSFNGVHQPSFERTFAREDVYIFSYFYDRLSPLGMPSSFTLKEMHDVTSKVCGGEKEWSSFKSFPEALAELNDRPEHCLDLNFQLALLHIGYEMPLDREVKIAKKIKNKELGWCLGASLPLLDNGDGGWSCRIHEVTK